MPFTISKLLGLLAAPSTLLILGVVWGLWRIRRGKGAGLAWASAAGFLIAGFSPIGNVFILPLEQRFANVAPPSATDRVDGIILLGGFEDGWVSAGRGGLGLNESAERVTEGLRLALRHPNAKVVFTGGAGGFITGRSEASGPVADFLVEAGIARERLVLENQSRNTYENAVLTREIVKPQLGERWYLVTSAFHIPRSMGLFRKAGFDVIAYPVDYRTRGPQDVTRVFERISQGLMRVDAAINEWIGLAAYRALGRIDEFFPAP